MKSTQYFSFSKSPIGFKPTKTTHHLLSHPPPDSADGHRQIFAGFRRRPILQSRHSDPFSILNSQIPAEWPGSGRSPTRTAGILPLHGLILNGPN
jgi:hypothetical protein